MGLPDESRGCLGLPTGRPGRVSSRPGGVRSGLGRAGSRPAGRGGAVNRVRGGWAARKPEDRNVRENGPKTGWSQPCPSGPND